MKIWKSILWDLLRGLKYVNIKICRYVGIGLLLEVREKFYNF